jgi:ATP-binding cassette, subfamily B, bacterial
VTAPGNHETEGTPSLLQVLRGIAPVFQPPVRQLITRAGVGLLLGSGLLGFAAFAGISTQQLIGADAAGTIEFTSLAAMLLLVATASAAQSVLSAQILIQMESRARNKLFAALTEGRRSVRGELSSADAVTRLTHDITDVANFFASAAPSLVPQAAIGIIALGFMFQTSAKLALGAGVLIAALLVAMAGLLRTIRPIAERRATAHVKLSEEIQTMAHLARVNRAFGREEQARSRVLSRVGEYAAAAWAIAIRTGVLSPLGWLIATLVLLFVVSNAADGSLGAALHLGDGVSFAGYALILARAAGAVVGFMSSANQASASAQRLNEILFDANPRGGTKPFPAAHASVVEFKDVWFKHGETPWLLRGVNLRLVPGEVTVLTGPNGAGKTTLTDLLLRFVSPIEGQVLIGGDDLAQISADELAANTAWVPQESALLPDTIEANIRWGSPTASRQAIDVAARMAGLSSLIDSTPDGLQRQVGERGSSISGGERQRIALARAIVADTPLLILDEATSMYAPGDEARTLDELMPWFRERVVLIISHRPETAIRADRVCRLDGGMLTRVAPLENM